MTEEIDQVHQWTHKSLLIQAMADGVEAAAEETRSAVMAEVRQELAPIYRRLDRLEEALGRGSKDGWTR